MNGLTLFLSFFPPVLTPSYLLALVEPVMETIGMAVGAIFIAFCVSIPLGVAAGLRLSGARTELKSEVV
ncbi:hypothetical protein, partial [Burkholderia sp. AU4i]|uniref:hypothetical protein n=1 Tax=Burkholderia sp. AU4i TaxID=1335308 RepID=UPI003F8AFA0E